MSTVKKTCVIAFALVAAVAASATSAAWAARDARGISQPTHERGQKTYLPGEGGCNSQHIYWVQPCGD